MIRPMNAPAEGADLSLEQLLRTLVENKGSDLHLQVGEVPIGRIDGELGRFELPPLTRDDLLRFAREILETEERYEEFLDRRDYDTALSIEDLARFRANLYFQRNQPGIVLRVIGTKILSVDELGLPEVLKEVVNVREGLVLVTGATGSGKSTTLAALIDHINTKMSKHVMTLEDPIEFVHSNKAALVNQREINVDSPTFASALRQVLRQDPDVILIGEIRDLETVKVALAAAETGHLVLATLHTQDASESLERLLNMYPPDQVHQIRMQLSLCVQAIVCQKLVPRKGGGRTGALEILIGSPRVRKLILMGETNKVPAAIQASQQLGMQTFNQALVGLVKRDLVEEEEALKHSPKPDELRMNLKGIFSGTSGL